MHAPHEENHSILEPMDDPEPGSTWFISIAGTVVFIALVLALSVLYFSFDEDVVKEEQIDAPIRALTDLRQSQKELLAQYARYQEPQPDGAPIERIRIPIARAMEIVSAELVAGGAAGRAATPVSRSDASAGERDSNSSFPHRAIRLGQGEP